jgi:hypothetical protein
MGCNGINQPKGRLLLLGGKVGHGDVGRGARERVRAARGGGVGSRRGRDGEIIITDHDIIKV